MTSVNDPDGPGSRLTHAQIVYRLSLALEALESIENAWAIDHDQVIKATVALGQKPSPWSDRERDLQQIQVWLEWLIDEYTEHDDEESA
jgi:hypothetical protein